MTALEKLKQDIEDFAQGKVSYNYYDKEILEFLYRIIEIIKNKKMAKNEFVVQIEGTDLYLTGYNAFDPPNSIFGNLENAIIFSTLEDAQQTAAAIGGGSVGTPK